MQHPLRRPGTVLVALAGAAVIGLMGCDRGSVRTEQAYCEVLEANADALGVVPATVDDSRRLTASVTAMLDAAPLQVDDEWATIAAVVDLAQTVDLNDQRALDTLARTAVAATASARTIAEHAKTACNVDLPEIPALGGGSKLPKAPPKTAPPPLTIAVPTTAPPTTVPPSTAAGTTPDGSGAPTSVEPETGPTEPEITIVG